MSIPIVPSLQQTPRIYGFDAYSLSCCPLTLWRNDICLSTASGFLWRIERQLFLVTNWHVLSGRRNDTGQPINAQGALPNRLEAGYWVPIGENLYQATAKIDLVGADGNASWLQHPTRGHAVDIAAVGVAPELLLPQGRPLNEIPAAPELQIRVGSDVFILGWPLPPSVIGDMPVWKRGTIAVEPKLKVADGLLFVDTTTRPGMSGSAVIVRSNGTNMGDDPDSWAAWQGTYSRFIGVYSGRQNGNDDLSDVQLGRVWEAPLVDEVCLGDALGSFEMPNDA